MPLAQNDLSSAVQRRLGTNPANYKVDPSSYDQRRGQVVQGANDEQARQKEALDQRLASQGIGDSGIRNAQERSLDYNTRMGAASQQNAIDNDQFDKEFLAQQSEQERNQNNDQFTKGLAQQGQIANRGLDIQETGQKGSLGLQEKGLAQQGQLGNRSLDVQQAGQAQTGQIANRGLDIQQKGQEGQLALGNRSADISQQGVNQQGEYQQGTLAQNQQQITNQAQQFGVTSGQTQQQIDQGAQQFAEKMGYDWASMGQQDKQYFAGLSQQGDLASRGLDIQQQGQAIGVKEFYDSEQNKQDLTKLQGDINANLYGIQHGYAQGDAESNAKALSYYSQAAAGKLISPDELEKLKTSDPTAYWSYQDGAAASYIKGAGGTDFQLTPEFIAQNPDAAKQIQQAQKMQADAKKPANMKLVGSLGSF